MCGEDEQAKESNMMPERTVYRSKSDSLSEPLRFAQLPPCAWPAGPPRVGANYPGSPGSGAPSNFFWGASHFFGRNISVFRAKYRNFVWKKLRKQFKRSCPEKIFPKKLSTGEGGEGPQNFLPRAPEKLSAALLASALRRDNLTNQCLLFMTVRFILRSVRMTTHARMVNGDP